MSKLFKPDPVQIEAWKHGKDARKRGQTGFGYIMEQGLGKTSVACGEALEMYAEDAIDCVVIVAPNSFKAGWVEEIKKQGFPINSFVFESGADSINEWWLRKTAASGGNIPMLIVNYEAIRSEATREYIRRFKLLRRASIYFDESIQISTHDSAQTKKAIDLAKEFVWRVDLSGKWMKQGPHDFWSQLRSMGAINGYNYYGFKGRFCATGGFRGKKVTGTQNEEQLAKLISPWIFQAKKKDWGINIGRRYTAREYKMTKEMNAHFTSMWDEFVAFIGDGMTVSVDAAITKYIKLAQIQCGFIIDENQKIHQLVEPGKNPRLLSLLDFIENELTGKIAVPYKHVHVGKELSLALQNLNPAVIKGGMTPDEIERQKSRFNNDPGCRAILLQTVASKYGHTLLGHGDDNDRCWTMYFYENTYSLDDRSQIEDRIHRRGQTSDYCGYVDSVGTPVDMAMIEALQRKENIYNAIMRLVKGGL
jgi:hypothetical protein